MVSIYDYTNYRCFLRDRFSAIKRQNPLFSYRSFNRLAGLKNSGFLKLVIDGKKNLAENGIRKLALGFKLGEAETKYFAALVRLNQAGNQEEKSHYFRELSRNKRFVEAKPLTAAQYNLFSRWYYAAILELVRLFVSESAGASRRIKDEKWLQSELNPPVGLREIKKAVRELRQLDLLSVDNEGSLVRRDAMLRTDDEVASISAFSFHSEMIRLAARAVIKERGRDREFSTLTVATSAKGFQRAKQEIQRFRKRLHSILEMEDDEPRRVVGHINLQLFKLNRSRNGSGGSDGRQKSETTPSTIVS